MERRGRDPRENVSGPIFRSRFNGVPNYVFWTIFFGVAIVIFATLYGTPSWMSPMTKSVLAFTFLFLLVLVIPLRFGGLLRQDEIIVYEDRIEIRQPKWGSFLRYYRENVPIDRTFSYRHEHASVIFEWDRDQAYKFELIFPTKRSLREIERLCDVLDGAIAGRKRYRRTAGFSRPASARTFGTKN